MYCILENMSFFLNPYLLYLYFWCQILIWKDQHILLMMKIRIMMILRSFYSVSWPPNPFLGAFSDKGINWAVDEAGQFMPHIFFNKRQKSVWFSFGSSHRKCDRLLFWKLKKDVVIIRMKGFLHTAYKIICSEL